MSLVRGEAGHRLSPLDLDSTTPSYNGVNRVYVSIYPFVSTRHSNRLPSRRVISLSFCMSLIARLSLAHTVLLVSLSTTRFCAGSPWLSGANGQKQ